METRKRSCLKGAMVMTTRIRGAKGTRQMRCAFLSGVCCNQKQSFLLPPFIIIIQTTLMEANSGGGGAISILTPFDDQSGSLIQSAEIHLPVSTRCAQGLRSLPALSILEQVLQCKLISLGEAPCSPSPQASCGSGPGGLHHLGQVSPREAIKACRLWPTEAGSNDN